MVKYPGPGPGVGCTVSKVIWSLCKCRAPTIKPTDGVGRARQGKARQEDSGGQDLTLNLKEKYPPNGVSYSNRKVSYFMRVDLLISQI